MNEFTFAQIAALETMLPLMTRIPRRLNELTVEELREINAVMWKLPGSTTRQYVTQQAIIDKVGKECAMRNGKLVWQ